MEKNLAERIQQLEYRGYRGAEAVEVAYQRLLARYDEPKTTEDVMVVTVLGDNFEYLCDMYFALHPDEAQLEVDRHNEQYPGIHAFCGLFAYWGNPIRAARYRAAKKRVGVESP